LYWNACLLPILDANVVTTWAYTSVVPDEVLASSNTTASAFAIVFVTASLLPLAVSLDLIAVVTLACVRWRWPNQINTLTFFATSVLFAIVYVSALVFGRGSAQLPRRQALNIEICGGIVLPASREACIALVHSFLFVVDSTKLALSVKVPLLVLSAMALVHVHVLVVVIVIQAIVIMLGLQASCVVEVPLLVLSVMARVHVHVLIVGIVIQAAGIMLGLQASCVIEEPLLVLSFMAWVHVHVLVVVIVIKAAGIILSFQWSSWSWGLDLWIIAVIPFRTATRTAAARDCFAFRPLETLQP